MFEKYRGSVLEVGTRGVCGRGKKLGKSRSPR